MALSLRSDTPLYNKEIVLLPSSSDPVESANGYELNGCDVVDVADSTGSDDEGSNTISLL